MAISMQAMTFSASDKVETIYNFLNSNKGSWFDEVTLEDTTITCKYNNKKVLKAILNESNYNDMYYVYGDNDSINGSTTWNDSTGQNIMLCGAKGGIAIIYCDYEFSSRGGVVVTTANTNVPLSFIHLPQSDGTVRLYRYALTDTSNIYNVNGLFVVGRNYLNATTLMPILAQSDTITYTTNVFALTTYQYRYVGKLNIDDVNYFTDSYIAIKDE